MTIVSLLIVLLIAVIINTITNLHLGRNITKVKDAVNEQYEITDMLGEYSVFHDKLLTAISKNISIINIITYKHIRDKKDHKLIMDSAKEVHDMVVLFRKFVDRVEKLNDDHHN